MHNNALIIERYALELGQRIEHQVLTNCVSTSSEDVHFLFNDQHYVQVIFSNQGTYFMLREASSFPKRKTINQFKACVGQKVQVVPHPHNRSFSLTFGEQRGLHILCYGRHNGIIETEQNEVVSTFRLANVGTFSVDAPVVTFPKTLNEFGAQNRFVSPEQLALMTEATYAEDPKSVWQQCASYMRTAPLYICDDPKRYNVSFECGQTEVKRSTSVVDILHDYAKLQLARERFKSLRTTLLTEAQKQLKKASKRLANTEKRLSGLANEKSKKELGDILMANLHAIPAGAKQVTLFDFYDNADVTIKLNEKLSPQENAERLYKKSKNVHIERDIQIKNQAQLERQVTDLRERIAALEEVQSYRELTQFDTAKQSRQTESKTSPKPYKSVDFEGFEIWIGKDAKANDALLKLLSRNDIWLHARGVSGSHVAIKNNSEQRPPEHVIERAAQLAAWHSKSKNESLAAVIYTSPKYIRKFKGALPGQVRVDREEVILVEPLRP